MERYFDGFDLSDFFLKRGYKEILREYLMVESYFYNGGNYTTLLQKLMMVSRFFNA